MKHFLLEGQHLVPFEQRDPELIAAHRRFLQQGYDNGRFLLSGPHIPPTSRSMSQETAPVKDGGQAAPFQRRSTPSNRGGVP